RFADDIVIHGNSEEELLKLKEVVEKRLSECKLNLHPDKTQIVYCKDSDRTKDYPRVSFDFLGYTFAPRSAKNSKTGKRFTSFLPAASKRAKKSFNQKLKGLRLKSMIGNTIEEVADLANPLIRGWFNYFAGFYRSAVGAVSYLIDRRLTKWARKKYRWG